MAQNQKNTAPSYAADSWLLEFLSSGWWCTPHDLSWLFCLKLLAELILCSVTTLTFRLQQYTMTTDRDTLVYKAKLAEQAERFDEMVTDMKEVAKQPQELTVEERNLLSVAYKNVIGARRASWRVVTSIEQKGDQDKLPIIKDYKAMIEQELVDICNEILSIIEDSLIPNSTSEEAKVFYYKMKGE